MACCLTKNGPDSDAIIYSAVSNNEFSTWMTNLSEQLQNAPLCQIAIPGSHDSCTAAITPTSAIGPDLVPILQEFAKYTGRFGRRCIYNWSKTQSLQISDQLSLGIRYFDLRLCPRGQSRTFWSLHGLFCDEILDVFRALQTFLDQNPKEVVLLDFNHFYAMKNDDHIQLTKLIVETFQHKLCPRQESITNLNLKKMWQNQWQVIVFYRDIVRDPKMIWSDDSCISPWPNSANQTIALQYLENHLKTRPNDKFYVCQGILTPQVSTVLSKPCFSLKTGLVDNWNPIFLQWVKKQNLGANGLNIVILDFVDLSCVQCVLNLNI